MKKYSYTTTNGDKQVIKAQNLNDLYEKIKGKYIGNVHSEDAETRWAEIVMPQVKK